MSLTELELDIDEKHTIERVGFAKGETKLAKLLTSFCIVDIFG